MRLEPQMSSLSSKGSRSYQCVVIASSCLSLSLSSNCQVWSAYYKPIDESSNGEAFWERKLAKYLVTKKLPLCVLCTHDKVNLGM